LKDEFMRNQFYFFGSLEKENGKNSIPRIQGGSTEAKRKNFRVPTGIKSDLPERTEGIWNQNDIIVLIER
jgi:hypothetical protein